MSLLGTVDVTVLGYHVLPEQTPPDQARLQFGERATSALEDLSQEFRTAGGDADHRLVFTRDREQTVRRVADEVGADAFAVSGPTGDVDRILVSVSGDVDVDRIISFVETLVGGRDIGVTLFLAAGTRGDGADGDGAVEGDVPAESEGDAAESVTDEAWLAAVADRLRGTGVETTTELAEGGPAFDALIGAAAGHDAVVMAERAPSFRSLVFGDESERVAAASVGPVLVVRDRESGASSTSGAEARSDREE
ncbi:universal stress protein [Halorubrum sp. DM2]|nr:universal stress protein [Halorubrum sp. DM2]